MRDPGLLRRRLIPPTASCEAGGGESAATQCRKGSRNGALPARLIRAAPAIAIGAKAVIAQAGRAVVQVLPLHLPEMAGTLGFAMLPVSSPRPRGVVKSE